VAPRPGLEPGTYGLTVELTPISMAAKLKIRNVFFLRIRPIVSDRAYPEPWRSVGGFLGAKTRTKSRKSPHFAPTGNRTDPRGERRTPALGGRPGGAKTRASGTPARCRKGAVITAVRSARDWLWWARGEANSQPGIRHLARGSDDDFSVPAC